MRIATSGDLQESDLTARARIRESAISCFAEEGFDASFRTIATRTGVSPGLITHHFGSKRVLRAECDAEVLRRYQTLKTDSLADPSGYLRAVLSGSTAGPVLMVYLLRAIHAGGEPARTFLEHLVDSAREVMRVSVEKGVVRPSRDEEARLRYLIYQTIGALLIQFLVAPPATPDQFVASVSTSQHDQILPTLELFTDGLLATRQMLDDYLDFVGDPPAADGQPGQGDRRA